MNNSYMAIFVLLEVIYAGLLAWGIVMAFSRVIIIGAFGTVFCGTGWILSRDYLS